MKTRESIKETLEERCEQELIRRFEKLWGTPFQVQLDTHKAMAYTKFATTPKKKLPEVEYTAQVKITMKADNRPLCVRLTEIYTRTGRGKNAGVAQALKYELTDRDEIEVLACGLKEISTWLAGYKPAEA